MTVDLSFLLPPPISPTSPTFFLLWTVEGALLLGLSWLAQRKGTRTERLALGGAALGVVRRLGAGGLDLNGGNTFWNFPYSLAILPTASIIPRLSLLPSSVSYTHLAPHLVPSSTIDLVASPAFLNWHPPSYAQVRSGPFKSPRQHVWAWARGWVIMLGLWGLALGLFPIWDAYELGRKEWFTELGVGVIAGGTAYCVVETAFHGGAAVCSGLLGWDAQCFPEIMQRPWKATSIHDFWSHRWHSLLGPIFLYFTSLLTFTPMFRVTAIFLLSGLYHEFGPLLIQRSLSLSSSPHPSVLHPSPPNRSFYLLQNHIFTPFFIVQAVPFLLESAYKKLTGKRVGGVVGWVWCWVWLFGTGRWVSRAMRDGGLFKAGEVFFVSAWDDIVKRGGEGSLAMIVDQMVAGVQGAVRSGMEAVGW